MKRESLPISRRIRTSSTVTNWGEIGQSKLNAIIKNLYVYRNAFPSETSRSTYTMDIVFTISVAQRAISTGMRRNNKRTYAGKS